MRIGILAVLLVLASCNPAPDAGDGAVARVQDEFLMVKDIEGLVPKGTAKEDSVLIVRNFIDRWASRRLLLNAADVNIGSSKRAELDQLVAQYKSDLYVTTYLDEIVKRSVDTVVTEEELSAFYKNNKENFKTNGLLVRLRYLHLEKGHPKFGTIRSKFFDYRKSDRQFWQTYSMQMNSSALNDSVWVDMEQVYARLPFITPENRDKMISPGKAIEQPDGENVYLVKILGVIGHSQLAPYQYVRPTLKDIIINSRKLEMIKKFEKEIIDDALKGKDYEIYK